MAKFEEWDAAGRTFDAVIAGQAWHWVDMTAGAAKAAAVLRPGGRLAVFWNAFDPPAELREAFGAVYQRVVPDSPMAAGFWSRPASVQYLAMCDTAADGMRRAGAFDDPQTWRFDWSRPYTRAQWLDQVPTFGGHSLLPPRRAGGAAGRDRRGRRRGRRRVHDGLRHAGGHGGAPRASASPIGRSPCGHRLGTRSPRRNDVTFPV